MYSERGGGTAIYHFDDPDRNTVRKPYGQYASNWTVDRVVICELPRQRGLPTK